MHRMLSLLTDTRTLSLLGLAALVGFLFVGADTLQVALAWAALVTAMILVLWLAVWLVRRRRARRAADELGGMLEQQAETGAAGRTSATSTEVAALRARLQEAVQTIKSSKLGQYSGRDALYELPWYITIGNPAAGKSTALVNSGLTFPFEDDAGRAVKGIGGTRNCDWFFTTEGILLDTAGRYAVHEEDRGEWLGFLDQLKKHRPRAPINGIIVTVSIPELLDNPPAFAITLARNLRQRVQELTERLEVFAPVYVMFSKADLVPGFREFFADLDWNERDRVWGATFPYRRDGRADAIARFERHFDELAEGLREVSVAQLATARGDGARPELLSFPLEFAALKPALRSFVATLFEDNPYQFEPVFRGFYITSALQSGTAASSAGAAIAARYELRRAAAAAQPSPATHSYFLRDLFSKVVFADRGLVQQYASRRKLRLHYAGLFGALAALGLALGGWSWSYVNNRALVDNVRTDLAQAVRVQQGRFDLASRFEALGLLQDRIAQLERLDADRPLAVGLGLFQGRALLDKLVREYYAGMRNLLLGPVSARLESYLAAVDADGLAPREPGAAATPGNAPSGPYRDMDPDNAEDAYNALKTYVMLGDRERLEVGHLADQMTRFWRGWLEANRGGMPRDEMMRAAERLLSFHLQRSNAAEWPLIEPNLAIVDRARTALRGVMQGMPAAERVYAVVRARAATRFPPVTVDALLGPDHAGLLGGGHVVSGAFTTEAWRDYVRGALEQAATDELASADWVLQTRSHDDLSVQGSPEQIQKTLAGMYQREYVQEWQRFLERLTLPRFPDFATAVTGMNRLGDAPNSPLGRLLQRVHEQTSWDNPVAVPSDGEPARQGFVAWFKRSILRQAPPPADTAVAATTSARPRGPVGEHFVALDHLLAPRDDGATLAGRYLEHLGRIRARLNQLTHQGDPGPGAVELLRETVEGDTSELAQALRFVDEQMLGGLAADQRETLRPLLVSPLLHTYTALLEPGERELNRTWQARVYDPFVRQLAAKYPFSADAGVEAAPTEIAQIFGPEGAIAGYVDEALGPLVVRRGSTIAARTWGDLGVRIRPAFQSGFARWVHPLRGAAAGAADTTVPQTAFMLMPHPAPGTTQYVVEIDGQKLRYRNGAAQWANFVWPNPGGTPGARVVATTFDGRSVEVIGYNGRFGLEKLINTATRTRKPDGSFQLAWTKDELTVKVDLRVVSSAQAESNPDGSAPRRGLNGVRLPAVIAGVADPDRDPGAVRGREVAATGGMRP